MMKAVGALLTMRLVGEPGVEAGPVHVEGWATPRQQDGEE
jgi:hypothetical protein